MSFAWRCPYCNHDAMIGETSASIAVHKLDGRESKDWQTSGILGIESRVIVCPNPECKEYSIYVYLGELDDNYGDWQINHRNIEKKWDVRSHSSAKKFPSYIPVALRNDYEEACLIKDLSPKASATLSRRCLQGIIREFWEVKRPNLYQEIEAIKDRVDPSLWRSINAIREIGNIGAHMEKDIDKIIDVDPEEAKLLIKMIEVLFEKTYIRDYEENKLFEEITQIAEEKKELKEAN